MSLRGIDISNHQRGIDLSKVNCDFVIMKATEGKSFVDKSCDTFFQQALKLGKKLGVYHFANNSDNTAQQEADWFINNTKGYIGKAIPILDWEDNVTSNVDWALEWLQRVEKAYGCKPMIYMSESVVNRHDWSKVVAGNYGLWVAKYRDNNPDYNYDMSNAGSKPSVKYWNGYAMWQWTSTGRLDGYNGNLDCNEFYGDAAAWDKYVGKGEGEIDESAPTPEPAPAPSAPTGSTLDLAYYVMKNNVNGQDRKNYLSSRYEEVQSFINHIFSASVDTLVQEVKDGKYGNNPVRETVLGARYQEVQDKINAGSSSPSSSSTYTVVSGDTLSGIGAKLGVNWQSIASANGIKSPYTIYPGQKLTIPGGSSTSPSRTYTVKSGDTLSGIGAKLGVNWKDIASKNGISSPYTIYPGQKLKY